MATILLMPLPRARGHLHSFLALAAQLSERGHTPVLNILDADAKAVPANIRTIPLTIAVANDTPFIANVDLIARARPSAVITDSMCAIGHLIAHKLQLPIATLHTTLPDLTSGNGIIHPTGTHLSQVNTKSTSKCFAGVLNITACPAMLELPGRVIVDRVYGDPLVDLARHELTSLKLDLPPGNRLAYASFGTELRRSSDGLRLFAKIIETMRDLPGWSLIIGASEIKKPTGLRLSNNMIWMPFAPQLAILKRASVALIHGGLNSVKECILMQVPMLICPFEKDQLDNAERISYHSLGVQIDPQNVTVDELRSLVVCIAASTHIKEGLRSMSTEFLRATQSQICLRVIEKELIH